MDTNSLRNGTDEPVCRAEIVMQMREGGRLVNMGVVGKERVGWTESGIDVYTTIM